MSSNNELKRNKKTKQNKTMICENAPRPLQHHMHERHGGKRFRAWRLMTGSLWGYSGAEWLLKPTGSQRTRGLKGPIKVFVFYISIALKKYNTKLTGSQCTDTLKNHCSGDSYTRFIYVECILVLCIQNLVKYFLRDFLISLWTFLSGRPIVGWRLGAGRQPNWHLLFTRLSVFPELPT